MHHVPADEGLTRLDPRVPTYGQLALAVIHLCEVGDRDEPIRLDYHQALCPGDKLIPILRKVVGEDVNPAIIPQKA